MKKFFQSVGFKVLCGIACFLIGMMIYAASTGGMATVPATVAGAIITPLQSAFSSVSQWASDVFSFGSNRELTEQIEQLQEEINTLRQNQVELDELRRKNELYAAFLELKEENPEYQFVDARVIASDPTDLYGNFTIGAGSLSGIQAGDTVITPAGLVGVVSETGLNYAKVRTILDPALSLSAYDSRTREDGLLGGSLALATQGQLQLTQMDRDVTAEAGDIVVTYGGRYPEGLLVGQIVEITAETDGLSKVAVIQPFAELDNLSEVFVIVNYEDPTAEQTASTDAAD